MPVRRQRMFCLTAALVPASRVGKEQPDLLLAHAVLGHLPAHAVFGQKPPQLLILGEPDGRGDFVGGQLHVVRGEDSRGEAGGQGCLCLSRSDG